MFFKIFSRNKNHCTQFFNFYVLVSECLLLLSFIEKVLLLKITGHSGYGIFLILNVFLVIFYLNRDLDVEMDKCRCRYTCSSKCSCRRRCMRICVEYRCRCCRHKCRYAPIDVE